MDDTRAATRWAWLVEEQERSGQSLSAFAAQHGLNPRTLSWWRWNLRRGPSLAPSLDRTVVLAFEDYRAHIVVDHDTDLELLRKILDALA